MKKYLVIMKTGIVHEVIGDLECRQMASLIFMDDRGLIVRAFAPETWTEVSLHDT